MGRNRTSKVRRDGWTLERRLRFLQVLGPTRSASEAAAAARRSLESANRLRNRSQHPLFAWLWIMRSSPVLPARREGHIGDLVDGQVAHRPGNPYRRESGVANVGSARAR